MDHDKFISSCKTFLVLRPHGRLETLFSSFFLSLSLFYFFPFFLYIIHRSFDPNNTINIACLGCSSMLVDRYELAPRVRNSGYNVRLMCTWHLMRGYRGGDANF